MAASKLFAKAKTPGEKKQLTELLTFIVSATQGSAGYANVPNVLVSRIDKLEPGLLAIKTGSEVDPGGNIGAYATSKGVVAITGSEPAPASNAAPTEAPESVSNFTLETGIELPVSKRGGLKGEVYPFKHMTIGQSFFVPATEDNPNPAKSLASTASSASKRYKDGRKFVVRARTTTDGEKSNGARVFCIAAPAEQAQAA